MIVKRLYLNMENWSVSRGSYQLGYIAENTVTLLQIATDIDTSCTYHLEQKINDESQILYLEQGEGMLTAIIPNTMLTKVGNANWQIVGIWADESVKKSNIFNVYISDSINADSEVPASEVTAFTEALADLAGHMSEVAGYAESASASANEASDYAENASVSAEGAATSAENASASAESASTSAQNAATSAESANASATNASTSASEASASASEASTSAENASTSATNASASASEASTHASNASASATTATEQASLASSSATSAQTYASNASTSATEASASATEASTYASNASASATSASTSASSASASATSAQTYASNASTSEQNCATYASNARASAEEAQAYVESLDNWTTVEFSLADFTYDENSGITYLRTEAPSGYEIEEIRGYFVLNKREAIGESNNNIVMDPSIPSLNTTFLRSLVSIAIPPTTLAVVATPYSQINTDLLYVNTNMQYTTNTNNISWENLPTLVSFTSRSKNINHTNYETTSFTLKTDVPYTNIRDFYGKLQYRVVPIA